MRIVYIFTSFPVGSETFLQREVRAMREQKRHQIELWSLWSGKPQWEGMPVRRYPFLSIFRVIFFKIPLWAWRCPNVLSRVWQVYMNESPPSLLNIGENLLGLAFALDKAAAFKANPPDLFHAVWGTMPAAAAWLLSEITGVPFSMGAHAYDIFRDGGDWAIRAKLDRACLIHTSTDAARRRLRDLGASPQKTFLIRRGLDTLPPMRPARPFGPVVRFLSIGRLVPKKGFFAQLEIYRFLRDSGVRLDARIVGSGGLFDALNRRITALGLGDCVTLTGPQKYEAVCSRYEWADIFVFTGFVADDGDRDGLPNVIPEAMAFGVPVLTTDVSGTTEAIADGLTGQVLAHDDFAGWLGAVKRLRDDADFRQRTTLAARNWVENEFCAHANASRLAGALANVFRG